MVNKEKTIDTLLRKGIQTLYDVKNPQNALKIFNKILEMDYSNAIAWAHKGETLIQLNKYEEAIDSLKKAFKINPKEIYACYMLGIIFESQGKLKKALKYYEKTIEINKKFYSKAVERRNDLVIKLGIDIELLEVPEVCSLFDEILEPTFQSNIYDKLELIKIESYSLKRLFHHSLLYGGLIGKFKMVIGELGGRGIDNELYISDALSIAVGNSHEVKAAHFGKRDFFYRNILKPKNEFINGWYCSIPLDGIFFYEMNFETQQMFQNGNSKGCVIVIYPQNFFNKNYKNLFEVLQLKDLDSEDYSRSAWKKINMKIIDKDFNEVVNDLEEDYREFMNFIENEEIKKSELKKLLNKWLDFEFKDYYMKTNKTEYLNGFIEDIIVTIEKQRKSEFRVNRYMVLKLENDNTSIYVNNRFFNQCKYLLLNIPNKNINKFREIDSIDEAASMLDNSMEEIGLLEYNISPEVEFWGHCSNLQAWYENDYDTRILHRNLAFPLLKVLTESGDPVAKRVFKEEIAKRIEMNYEPVVEFLLNKGYLNFLDNEELDYLLQNESLHPNIKKYITHIKKK